MSRPRVYSDSAARQRAYRQRVRQREVLRRVAQIDGVTVARTPFLVLDPEGQPVLRVLAAGDEHCLQLFSPNGKLAAERCAAPGFSAVFLYHRQACPTPCSKPTRLAGSWN